MRGLRIKPQLCKEFMVKFKKVLLNIPRHRNIIDDAEGPQSTRKESGGKGKEKRKEAPKSKLVLLCPSITTVADLTPALQKVATDGGAEMVDHELVLDWDYWNADQLLRAAMSVNEKPPLSLRLSCFTNAHSRQYHAVSALC